LPMVESRTSLQKSDADGVAREIDAGVLNVDAGR